MKKQMRLFMAGMLCMAMLICGTVVTGSGVKAVSIPTISYSGHVQNIGWMNSVKGGQTAGTTGRALRLEAVKIFLKSGNQSMIQYSAHVQDIGWQSWVSSGDIAGTTGKGYRMEAIRIRLTGAYANQYDIYYRLHIENYGWLGWAKNGENSGTTGGGLRAEAIQIRLVTKNAAFNRGGQAYYELQQAPAAAPAPANNSYTMQTVQITSNGQTVDTFHGVSARYIKGTGNSNTGKYCCARYVSNYYKTVYGVTVSNMFTGRTPAASSGYFYQTNSPMAGDIGYQLNSGNSGHWFIIKAVNGDGSYTVIEQNWKWMSGGKTYCTQNRKVYNSTKGFKAFRWSGR